MLDACNRFLMKRAHRLVLSSASCALIVSIVLQAAPAPQDAPAGQPVALPDTPNTPLFVRMCSDCHDAGRVVARRRTVAEWEDTLRKMIEEGAEGSEKDFEGVFDFLVTNFGSVFINGARADDLVRVIGISKKDADAILAYRTAKGDFKDFEALKQVPDIDTTKLEAHKDALRF